jgi:hypothetical protein
MPTTAQLEAYLAKLYAARSALLTGKSYGINGRTLTRVDERWVTEQIRETESQLYRRSGGETSVRIVFDRGGR